MKFFLKRILALVALFGLALTAWIISVNLEDETPLSEPNTRDPARVQTYLHYKEVIPPTEEADIQKIKNFIRAELEKKSASGLRPVGRDVHIKAHGCVRAEFKVNNRALPPELRVGVYSENKTYPAWIRYSNGNSDRGSDSTPGPRGMAIKLMEVSGDQTQDFLMINGPDFFVKDIHDYVSMVTSTGWFFTTHLFEFSKIAGILVKRVKNPLFMRYWSETPYALGTTATKFSAVPCSMKNLIESDRHSPDFLSHALAQSLMAGDACFRFMVQLQANAKTMPVEDPTAHWNESDSPFLTVAEIHIPNQTFDSKSQMEFCENLSFTPWHALPEHRPLGGINRARKAVYDAISTFRHGQNHVVREEPTTRTTF